MITCDSGISFRVGFMSHAFAIRFQTESTELRSFVCFIKRAFMIMLVNEVIN